jgi:hypothetical protein
LEASSFPADKVTDPADDLSSLSPAAKAKAAVRARIDTKQKYFFIIYSYGILYI